MSQEEAKVKKETEKDHTSSNSITHTIQPNTGNKKQKGKKERKEKNTGGKKKSPRKERNSAKDYNQGALKILTVATITRW